MAIIACKQETPKNDADIPTTESDTPLIDDTTAFVDDDVVAFDEDIADDGEEDADVAPDIDNHIGPSDKVPVEVDGDPWVGMLERVPFVWQNTKPEQSSDPDGIKELWYQFKIKEDWPLTQCTPTLYDQCAENYPHEAVTRAPCEEKAVLDPKIMQNSYDYVLTPYCWSMIEGASYPWFNVNKDAIVFDSSNADTYASGTFVFEFASKKLSRIARLSRGTPIYNGHYFVSASKDYSSVWDENDEEIPFYYDLQEKQYGKLWKMSARVGGMYYPSVSENYAIINIQTLPPEGDNKMHAYYTSTGEWDKWKEITFGADLDYGIGRPNLQNSYMISYNSKLQVIFCDLAKGESSCKFVSKTGELARMPVWGASDTFFYSVENANNTETFYKGTVTNSGGTVQTETLFTVDGVAQVYDADNDYLLYWKRIKEEGITYYNNPCYYRLADKKHFCLEDGINSDILYFAAEMSGHRLIFESLNSDLILRDMDGYCQEHPENCPFGGGIIKQKKGGSHVNR